MTMIDGKLKVQMVGPMLIVYLTSKNRKHIRRVNKFIIINRFHVFININNISNIQLQLLENKYK